MHVFVDHRANARVAENDRDLDTAILLIGRLGLFGFSGRKLYSLRTRDCWHLALKTRVTLDQ